MTPDVSVVVITWNDARRLRRAVRSVCEQSLRNLEVIIVDDCSTDDTPVVARHLCEMDSRVSYVRLRHNSGGCSAPRNAGVAVARAPYLMFLDSDDELLYNSCKSLLRVMEENEVDFITAGVERYFERSGRTAMWYPHLFTERKIVEDIRDEPRMLFDHLSTNKMYRRTFIDRHDLRFPDGIHYEDQLFSAKAYCLARRFGVVPWPVYRWRYSGQGSSISTSRHELQNVADRIHVAKLIDSFLDVSGYADLRADKDYKFLRHDFRLYLGDLRRRDTEWVEQFFELTVPYLDQLAPAAIERLSRPERICLHMVRTRRAADAIDASRSLAVPSMPPRSVSWDGDSCFWGPRPPADEAGLRELTIEDTYRGRTLGTARLRHEIEEIETSEKLARLKVRTYDPGGVLQAAKYDAKVNVGAPGCGRFDVPLQLKAAGDGTYVGDFTVNMATIPNRWRGIDGARRVTVTIIADSNSNTSPLLFFDTESERTLRLRPGQHIKLVPAQPPAGNLTLTWSRSGAMRAMRRVAPYARWLRKKVTSAGAKRRALRWLIRLVPANRRLALFEAGEGRGYAGSPRYIHEELLRRKSPLSVVWSRAAGSPPFPDHAATIERGSWRFIWALARARYWVDSHNLPTTYPKRRSTRYLQTWHGQTLKTIGLDTPQLTISSVAVRERHLASVARWDVLISPSSEFERTFVPANRFKGQVLRVGTPCNDPLVRSGDVTQLRRAQAARRALQVQEGQRVLLYAPTFRDGGGQGVRMDLALLSDSLAGKWVVVVRPHPYTKFTMPADENNVLRDGRQFADINDLLLATDVLVTDYSSVMMDFANTGRPMLFYTDDYDAYRNDLRGTYYDLAEIAPGPMLTETADLVTALDELDRIRTDFHDRYARFRAMFCSYETGHASAAVVDEFFEGLRQ